MNQSIPPPPQPAAARSTAPLKRSKGRCPPGPPQQTQCSDGEERGASYNRRRGRQGRRFSQAYKGDSTISSLLSASSYRQLSINPPRAFAVRRYLKAPLGQQPLCPKLCLPEQTLLQRLGKHAEAELRGHPAQAQAERRETALLFHQELSSVTFKGSLRCSMLLFLPIQGNRGRGRAAQLQAYREREQRWVLMRWGPAERCERWFPKRAMPRGSVALSSGQILPSERQRPQGFQRQQGRHPRCRPRSRRAEAPPISHHPHVTLRLLLRKPGGWCSAGIWAGGFLPI